MKNLFLAILATLFSFFLFSSVAVAEEDGGRWVDTATAYKDFGCVMRLQTYTRGMKSRWDKRCPDNFDDFYARLTPEQKKKALEEGKKYLTKSFGKKYPDLLEKAALNKFFLAHTGATPS